jgi:hypothetical protein
MAEADSKVAEHTLCSAGTVFYERGSGVLVNTRSLTRNKGRLGRRGSDVERVPALIRVELLQPQQGRPGGGNPAPLGPCRPTNVAGSLAGRW